MLGNKNTVKTFKLTVFAKKNQIAVSFQGLLSPNRQEAFLIFTRNAIFVEQKKNSQVCSFKRKSDSTNVLFWLKLTKKKFKNQNYLNPLNHIGLVQT